MSMCYEDVAPTSSTLPTPADYSSSSFARTMSSAFESEPNVETDSHVISRTMSSVVETDSPVLSRTMSSVVENGAGSTAENDEVNKNVDPSLGENSMKESRKRGRADFLARTGESIANDLAVDGATLSSTEEEEEEKHLTPRRLFSTISGEPIEDGELPPDHPDALVDTSDMIGSKYRNTVVTNMERDAMASQMY